MLVLRSLCCSIVYFFSRVTIRLIRAYPAERKEARPAALLLPISSLTALVAAMSERTSIPDAKTLQRLRSDYGQAQSREAPVSVAMAQQEPHKEPGCVKKTHRYFCGSVKATSYTMLAMISFAALFWVPIIWYVIVPAVLDMLAGATSVNIKSATMADPTATNMKVSAVVEINNAGAPRPQRCRRHSIPAIPSPPDLSLPTFQPVLRRRRNRSLRVRHRCLQRHHPQPARG